jgi:hypothetical protein
MRVVAVAMRVVAVAMAVVAVAMAVVASQRCASVADGLPLGLIFAF